MLLIWGVSVNKYFSSLYVNGAFPAELNLLAGAVPDLCAEQNIEGDVSWVYEGLVDIHLNT